MLKLVMIVVFASLMSLNAKEIRFAPLPKEKVEILKRDYAPFLRWLSEKTGDNYTLVMSADYEDLISKIKKGEVDIAYLGPLPFAKVRTKTDLVLPIVKFLDKDGNAGYTCSVIVRKESRLTSVSQLSNKKISLPQKLSTCGYYTARIIFDENKMELNNNNYSFDGNHVNVAFNVLVGDKEAGILQTSFFNKYEYLGLKKIYESKSYPGFMLAVNKRNLSDKKIEQIKQAILSIDPINNKKDAQITKNWGENIKYGATKTSENEYAEIVQNYKKFMDVLQ